MTCGCRWRPARPFPRGCEQLRRSRATSHWSPRFGRWAGSRPPTLLSMRGELDSRHLRDRIRPAEADRPGSGREGDSGGRDSSLARLCLVRVRRAPVSADGAVPATSGMFRWRKSAPPPGSPAAPGRHTSGWRRRSEQMDGRRRVVGPVWYERRFNRELQGKVAEAARIESIVAAAEPPAAPLEDVRPCFPDRRPQSGNPAKAPLHGASRRPGGTTLRRARLTPARGRTRRRPSPPAEGASGRSSRGRRRDCRRPGRWRLGRCWPPGARSRGDDASGPHARPHPTDPATRPLRPWRPHQPWRPPQAPALRRRGSATGLAVEVRRGTGHGPVLFAGVVKAGKTIHLRALNSGPLRRGCQPRDHRERSRTGAQRNGRRARHTNRTGQA